MFITGANIARLLKIVTMVCSEMFGDLHTSPQHGKLFVCGCSSLPKANKMQAQNQRTALLNK